MGGILREEQGCELRERGTQEKVANGDVRVGAVHDWQGAYKIGEVLLYAARQGKKASVHVEAQMDGKEVRKTHLYRRFDRCDDSAFARGGRDICQ
jgi:hypothetical protein